MDLLTVDEAAAACSVSRDTIRRRLRDGAFPGATPGAARGKRSAPWQIPRADLESAGLDPQPSESAARHGEPACGHVEALLAARDAHIDDLRSEIERLHRLVNDLAGALASMLRRIELGAIEPLDAIAAPSGAIAPAEPTHTFDPRSPGKPPAHDNGGDKS